MDNILRKCLKTLNTGTEEYLEENILLCGKNIKYNKKVNHMWKQNDNQSLIRASDENEQPLATPSEPLL